MKKEIKIFIKAIGLKPVDCEYIKDAQMIRSRYYTGFVFDHPNFIEMTKKSVEHKMKHEKECLKMKDYDGYVYNHTRPFRLEAFLNIQYLAEKDISKKYAGRLCSSIWIDSENPNINIDVWKTLLTYYGKDLMSFKEKKFLKSLPKKVTIYHGDEGKEDANISWTLSKKTAEFFAKRFTDDARAVTKKVVEKSKFLCYLNNRSEEEIIII